MSAIPEMTPSTMFFAARSVPPGNVWTFTFPWVRSETSFAQRSIWTQGKVADGGKLAYRSVIGSTACDVPGATNRTRKRTDRRTDNTDFAFTSASLGNGLGNLPHHPGENCPILPEPPSCGNTVFPVTETMFPFKRRRKNMMNGLVAKQVFSREVMKNKP